MSFLSFFRSILLNLPCEHVGDMTWGSDELRLTSDCTIPPRPGSAGVFDTYVLLSLCMSHIERLQSLITRCYSDGVVSCQHITCREKASSRCAILLFSHMWTRDVLSVDTNPPCWWEKNIYFMRYGWMFLEQLWVDWMQTPTHCLCGTFMCGSQWSVSQSFPYRPVMEGKCGSAWWQNRRLSVVFVNVAYYQPPPVIRRQDSCCAEWKLPSERLNSTSDSYVWAAGVFGAHLHGFSELWSVIFVSSRSCVFVVMFTKLVFSHRLSAASTLHPVLYSSFCSQEWGQYVNSAEAVTGFLC